MSKTTRRYGKPLYTMGTSIDANPAVPIEVKQQWEFLDVVTNLLFGCNYFKLVSKTRTYVHELLKKSCSKNPQSDKHLELLAKHKLLA